MAARRGRGPVGRSCAWALSEGFTLHLRPDAAASGDRITGMWLDGEADRRGDQTYSVTVNSFLATGGDNFFELANGTEQAGHRQDRPAGDGRLHGARSPPTAPCRSTTPSARSASPSPRMLRRPYRPGDQVAFDLSSLAFSTAADAKDTRGHGELSDGHDLGTFRVDNTVGDDDRDEYGTAAVSVNLPATRQRRRRTSRSPVPPPAPR